MNYYYAVNGQQTGPVAEEQLREMVASGALAASTLVWREGMAEWQPFATAVGGATPTGSALAGVECSVCHQTFPADQTIKYGTANVCAGCKPKFIQGLREGAAAPGAVDYATIGSRFAAKFIDNIILYVVNTSISVLMGAGAVRSQNMGLVLASTGIGFIIQITYQAILLGMRGQTLGKMAMKIKVVTPDGGKIGWGKAIGRPVAEILSSCMLAIGYIIAIWDPEKRALHDRLAGTRVIKLK